MIGLDTNDLVLRHSRPARIMRFKDCNHARGEVVFKIGENDHGDVGCVCPIEHYEDMVAAGHWEILDEGDIPPKVER